MPQPVFVIDAQVVDRVSYGLGLAPTRITSAVMRRLYTERNQFVGKKKGHVLGSFTRSVLRISRRSRPGKMPINVAGLFRGLVREPPKQDSVNGLFLKMGLLRDSPRPFVRGIMDLQKGAIHTSGKFMPVPVYKNLAKIGITGGFYRAFRTMMGNDELVSVRLGGTMLFISKDLVEKGANAFDACLFTGAKRVSIRARDFHFVDQWRARWPGFMSRLGNAVEREIRAVEERYVRAK
jgi:hypothetical protein